MSSKTILEKGSGLLTPNDLSTAVLNVVGRVIASDGTETVFEQQQGVKHTLGTIDIMSLIIIRLTVLYLPLNCYPF